MCDLVDGLTNDADAFAERFLVVGNITEAHRAGPSAFLSVEEVARDEGSASFNAQIVKSADIEPGWCCHPNEHASVRSTPRKAGREDLFHCSQECLLPGTVDIDDLGNLAFEIAASEILRGDRVIESTGVEVGTLLGEDQPMPDGLRRYDKAEPKTWRQDFGHG